MTRVLAAAAWALSLAVIPVVIAADVLGVPRPGGLPAGQTLARGSLVAALVFALPISLRFGPRTRTGSIHGDLAWVVRRDLARLAAADQPWRRAVVGLLELPVAVGLYARYLAHYAAAAGLASQRTAAGRVRALPGLDCHATAAARVCVDSGAWAWRDRFLLRATAAWTGGVLYYFWTPWVAGRWPRLVLYANIGVLVLDPVVGVVSPIVQAAQPGCGQPEESMRSASNTDT